MLAPLDLFSPTALGILLALVAAVSIAVMNLAIRVGTNERSAVEALFIVQFVNIAAFVPVAFVVYWDDYQTSPTSIAAFVAAGLVGTLLGRAFSYESIKRIGATLTDPIKASQPIYATIIAVIVLQESVTLTHLVGILLITVSIAIISWESTQERKDTVHEVRINDLSIPLLAALFYGIEPIFAKVGFAAGTSVVVGLSIKTLAAFVGFCSYLWYRNAFPSFADRTRSHLWLVGAGVLNTLFLLFYYLALEIAPVSIVVPLVMLSPIFVVAFSGLFLSHLERVTLRIFVAATTVVLGAILVTLS